MSRKVKTRAAEVSPNLEQTVDSFLRENPALAEAIRVFQISDTQYRAALLALGRPEIRVSNSTNEE